jgi:hypothetical protein
LGIRVDTGEFNGIIRAFEVIVGGFLGRGSGPAALLCKGEGAHMLANGTTLNKKVRTARLPLIKERYQKLILKQRQEIEKELMESFQEDFEVEMEPEAVEPEQAVVIEAE